MGDGSWGRAWGLEWGGMCSRDAARAKGNHPNNSSKTISVPAQEKHWRREEAISKEEVAASRNVWPHVCLMLSVGGKAELPLMVSSMGMTMQLRGV